MTAPALGTLQYVRVREEGAVCTIVLDAPAKRNALSPDLTAELLQALAHAREAVGVRVVVLTGEGTTFSSGGNLASAGAGGAGSRSPTTLFVELLERLLHFEKPVVARVNGHALGGGLGLVAACTFAVAVDDCELGTPEMNVGLFPMMILPLLARNVPRRRLLRMVLLGERLRASEACALGLLDEVVSRGELDGATERWVRALCTKSPSSLAAGLRAVAYVETARISEDLRWLEAQFVELLGTADAQEGLLAFAEKRPPKWSVVAGDARSARGTASGGGP